MRDDSETQVEKANRWDGLGPLRGAPGERFCRGPVAGVLLLLILAAVYLPGLFSIPTIDRDEARFAQASRQMLEAVALPADQRDTRAFETTDAGVRAGFHAGGLVVPMVQDRPRLNKPPLIYWLQTASAWIFTAGAPLRDAVWMYRVPSVISAIIACFATWRLGILLIDPRAAWLAAVLLGVCPMVVWDAHQARADQLLLACTTLSIWALAAIWTRRARTNSSPWQRWGVPILFWITLGLGILAKGPITPMVVVLTAVAASAVTGDFKWLVRTKPIVGVVFLAAMISPWVIAVGNVVGWDTLWSTATGETIGRSASAREGHWGPPGYHTLFAAALFWPGSLLTLAGFIRVWRLAVRLPRHEGGLASRVRTFPTRWRERVVGRDAEVFLVAWIVPSWIAFELIMTKLPHYTLPMYPALALVSAWAVIDAARAVIDSDSLVRLRLGLRIWGVIGAVLCAGGLLGLAILGGSWIVIGLGALSAGACLWLLWSALASFDRGQVLRAQATGVLAAIVFAAVFLQVVLPSARPLWITERLIDAIRAHDATDRPLASAVYHEDSLIFATRGRVERIGADQCAQWARRNPSGVLIAPIGVSSELVEIDWKRIEHVSGFNYAGGRVELLDVLERQR